MRLARHVDTLPERDRAWQVLHEGPAPRASRDARRPAARLHQAAAQGPGLTASSAYAARSCGVPGIPQQVCGADGGEGVGSAVRTMAVSGGGVPYERDVRIMLRLLVCVKYVRATHRLGCLTCRLRCSQCSRRCFFLCFFQRAPHRLTAVQALLTASASRTSPVESGCLRARSRCSASIAAISYGQANSEVPSTPRVISYLKSDVPRW